MSKHSKQHHTALDFKPTVRYALARKGITIIGGTWLPGAGDMPCANGERGYCLDDNGTLHLMDEVLTANYLEVVALAEVR